MPETMENTAAPTPAAAPRTDRLELVKEMGRGSIGVVHKAKNAQANRVIALRQFEVPEWLDDADELLKRILAEARVSSALDHPNIAKLYTCGYKGFTVFMTAEFVEGKTLKELMAERQPELGEILAMAKQLCAALDYAEEKKVVHQFLNPSNIKVLKDGTLKILDYGLVKDKNLMSQTPAKKLENEPYLSPEEVRNKPLNAAANLFSATAILYQLYTGRSPFAGKHLGEVDRNITDVNPHPLNMAHPRVPPAISTVILKALSKAPAERYKSGKQLVVALEDAMKGVPAVAPASKPSAPAKPAPAPAAAVESANYSGGYAPVAAKSDPAPAPAPAAPMTTTRMQPVAPPLTAKVQVGSANHWKLVAGVVACLVIVAGVAALFQRKPSETPEITEPQPVSQKPAPVRVQQPAASEASVSPVEDTSSATVASARRTKNSRAPHAVTASAPSAPQEGEVYVSSVPGEAVIEIEGLSGQVWKTPQAIGALAPGTYRLTVSKPGYAPDVRNVQVSAGNRVAVDVRLTAVKGWLNVGGSPTGSSILVDGKDSGKVTPATLILDPATHNITLRKAGYLDAGNDLQLAAGQTTSYSPTLMVAGRTDNIKIVGGGMGKIFGGGSGEGRARIEIKSEPKGAQVIINGTPLQKTTPVEVQVEAGNYDITIQKDGYQAAHENAIVGVDDHVKINKALAR